MMIILHYMMIFLHYMMILLQIYDDTFSASIVACPSPIPLIPVIKKMAQKVKEILEELNLHALIPQFERERIDLNVFSKC